MVFTGGLVCRGTKVAQRVGVAIAIAAAGLSAYALAADESQPIRPSVPPDLSRPHPFGVHDMVRMQRVGRAASFAGWKVDRIHRPVVGCGSEQDDDQPVAGVRTDRKLRQLHVGKAQTDTSPTWSPDSRTVAFVSNRSGSRQIWTIAVDGGEATQLTTFPWTWIICDGVPLARTSHLQPRSIPMPTWKRRRSETRQKPRVPMKAMKFDRLFDSSLGCMGRRQAEPRLRRAGEARRRQRLADEPVSRSI